MTHWEWITAVIVGVMSVARTARLITWDALPPAVWFRETAEAKMGEKWGKLVTCPYCVAPYLTAGMIAWAYLSDLHWTWWLANGWWAASYAAAIVVAYDEPE